MTEADTFTVRPATVADLEVLARHRVEMFRDMGEIADEAVESLRRATVGYLERALPAGEYHAWLASPAGTPAQIVAGAGLQLRTMLPRPSPDGGGVLPGPQGLVLNVFTEREWRRRGLAMLLMHRVLEWTRANDVRSVVLHASDDGRPLYERLGFVATHEMRFVPSCPR